MNNKGRNIVASLMVLALGSVGTMSVAHAEKPNLTLEKPKTYPRIESVISVEIENDNTFASQDSTAKINDLYNTTNIETGFFFNEIFSLQSLFVLEPVLDPRPSKDRTFGDIGGYFETLFLQAEFGALTLFAGKVDVTFGKAWDEAFGVFGTDFAEDYELAERIGFGLAWTIKNEYAQHVITATAFHADRTFLSNSVFTKRGRTKLSTAGPSNTKGPQSFSLTLDGSDIMSIPGLSYNIGIRHQAKGRGDVASETGFVLGALREFDLGNGEALKFIGEVAYFDNVDATADNRWYWTLGTEFTTGPWSFSVAHTSRYLDDNSGGTNFHDLNSTATAGYEIQAGFLEGVGINLGIKRVKEANVISHTLGLLFTKEFTLTVPN